MGVKITRKSKAKPAGSDGQVQFNDGGVFGADSNLSWDDVNKIFNVKQNLNTELGTEIVKNWNFDSGDVDWTHNSQWDLSSGEAVYILDDPATDLIEQSIALEVGETYVVEIITIGTSNYTDVTLDTLSIRFYNNPSTSTGAADETRRVKTFKAASTSGTLSIKPTNTLGLVSVSIKKIIAESKPVVKILDTEDSISMEMRGTPSEYQNVLLGTNSGKTLITGANNILIGTNSGQKLTTGGSNIMIGGGAGGELVTAGSNVAIGTSTASVLAEGTYNVFQGYWAGKKLTNASFNTFIGARAGENMLTPGESTLIGMYAGRGSSTASMMTSLGARAGEFGGTQSTYIGARAGRNNNEGTGNVFIGYDAGRDNTDSDKLIINNSASSAPLIEGSFSGGLQINNQAFSSVGQIIKGAASQSANLSEWQDSLGNVLSVVDKDGNVGIGTASPLKKLHITGSGQILRLVDESRTGNPQISFHQDATDQITRAKITYEDSGDLFDFDSDGGITFSPSNSESMRIDNAGNVGIGTTDPEEKLAVNGNMVLPKTSGNGIKVDIATPTFGYRDLLGEIRILSPGATDPTLATFRDGIKAFSFSNAKTIEAWINFHVPHDYVPGTDIFIHSHWSQNVVDTGAGGSPGDAKWQFEVTYAKGHDQAAFPATFTTSLVQTASSTQYQHMLGEIQLSASSPSATQLDSDDLEPDGIILVRVFRDPTDSEDTLNQVPFLHYTDIHYQSTNVATKEKEPDFWT